MSIRHLRLDAAGPPVGFEPGEGFFQREGVFTTFRVEVEGTVLAWEKHLARLVEGCEFFGYSDPTALLTSGLPQILSEVTTEAPVVRLALIPDALAGLELIASFRPLPETPPALRLTRVTYDRVFPEYKHLLPGPEQWMLPQVKSQGFDDYLRVNSAGEIAEACYANVFFVTEDEGLLTPDVAQSGCLNGVMRQQVLEACQTLGITVEIGVIPRAIPANVTGMFLTNAVRGLMPVGSVDEDTFEPEVIAPLIARISSGLRSRSTTSLLS